MNKRLRVTSPGLNLRSGPGTEHPVLAVLPAGAEVQPNPIPAAAPWVRVTWRWQGAWVTGWVSSNHLGPIELQPAPWMEHARAALARGVREVPGAKHHPEILHFHSLTSLRAKSDEVPRCSSFAVACMELAGIPSTRSAAAKSWLSWGRPLEEPVPGCVVVLSRGKDGGHVGFLETADESHVALLGGNQRNAVNVQKYPRQRVLGYRWPLDRPLPPG
ncbi:MAG: TIGR02594 family protein [Gemmatimonadota bacterium]